MTELEGFSDWVLALLPRLFLYPGGVWMLAALIGLRFASGGLATIKPLALVGDLVDASLPSLAVAWVALSLVALPGASALPVPLDILALVALVLVSLALDGVKGNNTGLKAELTSVAMAIAVLLPIVRGSALLGYEIAWGLSSTLSMLCIALGLALLAPTGARDISAAVRWLAWLGLGYLPVLAGWNQSLIANIIWTSLIYAGSIAVFALVGKLIAHYVSGWEVRTTAAVWGLATLALLVALLGY